MDELNQIQNPNVPPISQMPPMRSVASPVMPMKNKSSMFLVVLIAILAIGGFAWWYVGQMAEEPIVPEQPQINRETREDMMIEQEIQGSDLGDIDAEFKAVDGDLNSL